MTPAKLKNSIKLPLALVALAVVTLLVIRIMHPKVPIPESNSDGTQTEDQQVSAMSGTREDKKAEAALPESEEIHIATEQSGIAATPPVSEKPASAAQGDGAVAKPAPKQGSVAAAVQAVASTAPAPKGTKATGKKENQEEAPEAAATPAKSANEEDAGAGQITMTWEPDFTPSGMAEETLTAEPGKAKKAARNSPTAKAVAERSKAMADEAEREAFSEDKPRGPSDKIAYLETCVANAGGTVLAIDHETMTARITLPLLNVSQLGRALQKRGNASLEQKSITPGPTSRMVDLLINIEEKH